MTEPICAWLKQALHIVLLLCLLLSNAAVFAAPTANLRFHRVNEDIGGGSPILLQDRQGFIWMGTQAGLHRYDGYRSKIFRHEAGNPRSLPSDVVEAMFEDAQGKIWAGTRAGLARFDPETADFSLFLPPPAADGGESSRLIRDIVDDGRGGMWLATRGGLQHFDIKTKKFRIFRHDPRQADSLVNDNVATLARDARGGLWVASWPAGLDYLPPGSASFQHFHLPVSVQPNAPAANVRALLVDARQRLWIGTDTDIVLWNTGSDWSQRRRLEVPPGVSDFRVMRFYEDRTGTLWIATLEEGLLRWNEAEKTFDVFNYRIDDVNSLPSNSIRSILLDRSSTLWVGSMDGKLARSDLASKGFTRLYPRNFVPDSDRGSNLTFAFAENDKAELWIGGLTGALLIDPRENKLLRRLRHDPKHLALSLSSSYVHHLYQEPGGPLWIATAAGLNRFDANTGLVDQVSFGDSAHNSITRIAPGRGGVLWLASGGGLIRFEPGSGSKQYFEYDPKNPHGRSFTPAMSVLEDRAGFVWVIGGQEVLEGGVDVLDPVSGKFKNYRHDPQRSTSLAANYVSSLFEDGQGDLWLGTVDGVSRVLRKPDGEVEFVSFKGFASNHVTSIEADSLGKLWVSTMAGLSSLDPAIGKINNYASSDGVGVIGRMDGTAYRSKDGRIFFGGFNGVTVVTPETVKRNVIVPPVAMTEITVANRSLNVFPHAEGVKLEGSVTAPMSLSMSWKETVFTFEFAALHYADPDSNRFSYQLEGFDRGWIETPASRRSVTYTNLDPGRYIFRVKAANKNGVWSDKELRLPVNITPPFWRTWWFEASLATLLLGGLLAAYRWRIFQLTSNQSRLEQLVDERTRMLAERERSKTRFLASASHDLRQPIQAINLFLCSLKHTVMSEGQEVLIRHLDASIKSLKGLLDSLLDVSKLDAGAIVPMMGPVPLMSLLEAINFELSPLALDKGLRFKLYFPRQDVALYSDPQLIKVVLQNLVANAINYTEQGGVLLSARRRGGNVDIEIWDTGIGIGEADQRRIFDEFYQVNNPQRNRQKGLGLGLAIVKRTLALLDCSLSCRSQPRRGTVFRVRVPILPDTVLPSTPTAPLVAVDEKQFAGKLFIIVEDDEEAALGLVSWLQSIDARVLHYLSAEAALSDRQRVLDADYVISDFRLPGSLSGIDLLNAIRHGQQFRGVLVTGDTSPEFIERARASGWPVMFKPIDTEQLLRTLSV